MVHRTDAHINHLLPVTIENITEYPLSGKEWRPVEILTHRGAILSRYYEADKSRYAAVWIGGIGGDWDTPARGLYPRLCDKLVYEQISSLRVRYRDPHDLDEAVHDTVAGVLFLQNRGIERIGVIGHSFGGAVAIQTALSNANVKLVVTLATQSYGTGMVGKVAHDCALLLIHGENDDILPPISSSYVHRQAHKPKKLVIYPKATHNLDEVSEEVYVLVKEWIMRYVK
ncbi:MAG: alpha/beta hydrolase [Chitinivibrionales bacterium]|nr:alpha/beta hydrolase [Chitinivibrionales bacterium]